MRRFVLALALVSAASIASAQATRLAVLQAEDRRAPTAADLATIRSGAHSGDAEVARVAVRALGRLERPALIPDLLLPLRHSAPEVRAEAANAVAQAAQGWKREPAAAAALDPAIAALAARLKVETEPDVRAALAETIGRLPYVDRHQADKAEQMLVEFDARSQSVTDRLGVVKGLEALVRVNRALYEPGPDAIAALRHHVAPAGSEATTGARIRRLALEALVQSKTAGDDLVAIAAHDPDAQVRRIAMRGAPASLLAMSVHDGSAMVRLEALVQLAARGADETCALSLEAVADRDVHVALVALDQLSRCAASPDALAALDQAVGGLPEAAAYREWHRAAHALVALASASPAHAGGVLGQFTGARVWQLRMYAARAAAMLRDRDALEKLAIDEDDNVREAAVDGLRTVVAHAADAVFIAELTRPGYQVIRAAALGLSETPSPEQAIPALKAALERLVAEGRDNSHDAREALSKTLTGLGAKITNAGPVRPGHGKGSTGQHPTAAPNGVDVGVDVGVDASSDLNADDLRRLASPRARVTIRGVGSFDLALFTEFAPATVLRFARLAQSGYYNGLTFHRVVPNFVIQGGSPGANEYVGDARFMRDEVGLWPHVRGAVGISTRGRDTGDAQIFIDLVDNPRLDHEYTVFAQVLTGIDVVDQILEGDVIERLEIVPGP